MALIQSEIHGDIVLLRMTNGVTNAVNPQLVDELSKAVKAAETDHRGLVLAGGQKFFSIGFDLPYLLTLDRVGMTDFFNRFNKLVYDLYNLGIPTASALGGHTIAGGNILALATDYRYGAQGKKRIGLNEIKLGIPAPFLADMILRQLVGDRAATEMLYTGEFMTLTEAHETGLVDDLFLPEALEGQALLKMAEIGAYDATAFAIVKAHRTETVSLNYKAHYEVRNQSFIDAWFAPEVQEKLQRAARQF